MDTNTIQTNPSPPSTSPSQLLQPPDIPPTPMTARRSLARSQTSALLIRTYHWQRRQYCTLVCNFIIPPLILVLLSVLNRALQPPDETIFPFEQTPKGAFVPRPFDPVACLSRSVFNDPQLNDRCRQSPFQPHYKVPVYVPDAIASDVGQRSVSDDSQNSALLSHFSLDPFAYFPAIDPSSDFFSSQSAYDGVFLHSYFDGNRDNPIYEEATQIILSSRTDLVYNTSTVRKDSLDDLRSTLYDQWRQGPGFAPYSTALAFDDYKIDDTSATLAATVYYNESSTANCTEFCPLPSNLIRTYSALYSQLVPGKSAFAFLRRMPRVDPFNSLGIIQLVFSIILAQLTHFLLPSFLRLLVLERTDRMRAMMASMGLRRRRYWIGTYLSLFFIYLISIVIITIVGFATRMPFFIDNAAVSYIILFLLWGNVLVAMAMFLEPLFSNPETAQVVGWFYIIIVNIIGAPYIGRRLADDNTSESLWSAIMLLPTFAYMRSVYYAGAFNAGGEGVTVTTTEKFGVDLAMCGGDRGPFCRSYLFLAAEWVFLMIFAAYFDRVLPTCIGTRQHPLFFLGLKREVKESEVESGDEENPRGADVIEEERQAHKIAEGIESAGFEGVVLKGLTKTYGGKKPVRALKNLSLVAARNEVLCIVAHNGAGKTTAFRTLVGELEATSGDAFVNGKSVVTELEEVHRSMGVAPQQDILWESLSVEEHLFFYGRVKNLSGRALKAAVTEAMEGVQLTFARKRRVRALSGGMKRRLSVSIAMIGSPDFVLLDEPSTGLDILARQKLWEAIEGMRKNRVIMLTTHSLEEAEALSTRVAVMSRGELKCIGSAEELKMRLGKGHRLLVSVPEGRVGDLHGAVMQVAPGSKVEAVVGGNVEFVMERSVGVGAVVRMIRAERESLEIRDWSINQSTLEDVFLRVTREDAEARRAEPLEKVATDEEVTEMAEP